MQMMLADDIHAAAVKEMRRFMGALL